MKSALKLNRSAWLLLAWVLVCVSSAFAQLPANVFVNTRQFNFVSQVGSNVAVKPQTLQVISEQPRNFTITTQLVSPATGPNWISVNGASVTGGTTGSLNSFVTVSAIPTGLPAGLYTGNIRVALDGLNPVDVTVFLRVSNAPQPVASVEVVNLQGQTGASVPTLVTLSSTSAATSYTASVLAYYGASNWLTIDPASGSTGAAGSTPTTVTLNANLTSVPAGLHYAVVNFHSTGADQSDVTLPVILTVTQATTVNVNPTRLDFAFQASNLAATASAKVLNISASPAGNIAYTATYTGDARIGISKSSGGPSTTLLTGATPENIWVIVNPSSITAGTTVDGQVTISTANLPSITVPIQVRVTNQPILVPSVEQLNFNYSLGSAVPAGQTFSLTSTAGQLNYTAAEAEVTGGDWLTVTPGSTSTPGTISVTVNQTRLVQLAAGTYTANITVTSATAFNSPLTVPVTLTVSGTAALLNVSTSNGNNTLTFAAELNGTVPASQTVNVSSTDNTNQAFTLSVDPPTANSWLVLNPPTGGQTGTTGTFFTVGVLPSGVTQPGKYEADVVVTPQAAAGSTPVPQRVKVTFNVSATATVTATPARVDVTQIGSTPPAPVTIQVSSGVQGIQFLARSNQSWVTVSPNGGTLPATLTVSFPTATAVPGNYEAVITVAPAGAVELRIPVTLTVVAQGTLILSQNAFPVNYVQGTPAPANLTVGLTSSGAALPFTATSNSPWLTPTPASGTTTASGGAATNLSLAINPAGLGVGTHTGTVAVASPGASNSPQNITVTLTVTAASLPVIRSVENSARNETTLIAPGLILAIKGTNLGPATGVNGTITNNVYDTSVSDVRVLFDGVPAPILYARQDQINVVAPYSIFGRLSTSVVVEYRTLRSQAIEYRVVDAAPGIFTQTSAGTGAGSILNQNNTVNTANNPARRGEVIAIYATGEGAVRPAGSDGRVTSGTVDTLPRPVLPVSVRMNGVAVPADQITYAGSAPGLVAGALQVNVRIPANLAIAAATQVPIEIVVGTVASQPGVTVSVIP